MAIGAIEAISDRDFDYEKFVIIGYDGAPCSKTLLKIGNTAFKNTVIQDGFKLGTVASDRLLQSLRNANKQVDSEPEYLPNSLANQYYHAD